MVTARLLPFLPVKDFQWLVTMVPPHGRIASSLVLPQLQQFGATGPGAILTATAGRIRGGCLSFTCEQCESVPCFNSVFRCMWRGQTTRRLPCGCHRKRSVITTPRIRRANVMVKQTPHDKVQYTFVLFIHILPHINLAPKCRHTGSLGLVVPDQVEDDTEILIRYNVWGRGPKFWTGT